MAAPRRAPRSRRKRPSWSVDDARWFLESVWHAGEALYAAFVLVLVLGLRRGEALGLAWELLAALNVHPRVAMRILRHSKINVTMEIYAEAPPEDACDALRRLADLLG